jgi:hypothetical protein
MADTMLASYTADARGVLVFQGKIGERIPVPPVTVKYTEIATRVYWTQPGLSKQVIVGLRDTAFFPEDIGYYNDRYGIIQNNFTDVIRLGDGRDVHEVPHPLSAKGMLEYDFAIRDSSSITLSSGTIDIYVLAVRPKDASQPRVVGRLYITRADASVAKMALTFTRAAFNTDPRNESLTVTLENALVEGRFWLPRFQQMDLTRSVRALDFPAEAMIRARWEVYNYEVNVSLPQVSFSGPEIIGSPRAVLQQYQWEEGIMSRVPPDLRISTPQEVRFIRTEAEKMVQARALTRAGGAAFSAGSFSDFVRVNRVEGVAAGAAMKFRAGGGLSLTLGGRYGFADDAPKGRATLELDRVGRPSLRFFAEREYLDAGFEPERSLILNSIAAPFFGSDYLNLYDTRSVGVSVDVLPLGAVRPRLELSFQKQSALDVNVKPISGQFGGLVPARSTRSAVAKLELHSSGIEGPFGFSTFAWSLQSEIAAFAESHEPLRLHGDRYFRLSGKVAGEVPLGSRTLSLSLFAAGVHSSVAVPEQQLIYLGGPVTAPGYNFHELSGNAAAGLRAELRIPVPFVSISLGRYGRSPGSATLIPFAGTSYISGPPEFSGRQSGIYPFAGMGASVFYDLLRLDVARGLRDGRFTFSIDIMRDFWRVL